MSDTEGQSDRKLRGTLSFKVEHVNKSLTGGNTSVTLTSRSPHAQIHLNFPYSGDEKSDKEDLRAILLEAQECLQYALKAV